MYDSRQANLQLLSSMAFLLFVQSYVAVPSTAPGLSGQLASCNVENQVIHIPILAGNPCYVCRCKNKSVECSGQACPRINACKGIVKKDKGKCCPACHENQESTSCTHQGRTYKNNESWFERDCQICFCVNGTVTCEHQRCSRPESLNCPKGKKKGQVPGSCCPQCIEETGVCTSYGDPHYQTFDGQMFNFHGTCRYQLTSDCVSETFSIRMRNEQRYSNVYAWSKALTIHLGGSTIVLHKDRLVKVNRSDVVLPYYHLPHFQITKGSFTITLVSKIGVQVQWDGSGFIEIQVPKSFMGKVCGLCGNFNGNTKDEFTLKNGRLATSAREFGEGWSLRRSRNNGCEKAASPPVDSTVSKCFSRLRVYWRARKRCWPIKKQFANCHKKVKPNAFFWSCVSDVCQCSGRRCECEAVMAYARACRRAGVAVTWGRKNTCVSCKGGAVFDDCVPACQRTCDNKNDGSIPCPTRSCVPGCRCPAGTVWNSQRTKCIQMWKCPPQLASIQGKLRIAAVSSKRTHKWLRQLNHDTGR